MKYMLLLATCFAALLHLSAVTCRSAHEKITNKENEKYPTTMVPTVAYTGQEIERLLNSSDKLALDPGLVLHSDYYGDAGTNWPTIFFIIFFCFVGLTMILGCILACCRNRTVRAGTVISGPTVRRPSEAQGIQPSSVYNQHQNYQQQSYYQQQNYQQQNYQPQTYQQHNLPTMGDLPPPYQSVQQYQQHPQAVSQYQPVVQHLPPYQFQGAQEQIRPPSVQAQTLQDPSVLEFENPVCNVKQSEEAPLIKY